MTKRCLLLDYVPAKRGEPRPALAVWKGSSKTEVVGLGVRSGVEFDPFPFVSAFPSDSADVWVFAEWAYATAAMVEEGASLPELEAWVREDATAMAVSTEPVSSSKKALEDRFDTNWMSTRPAAMDALVFLAKESSTALVQAGTEVRVADPNGTTLAVLEVKRSGRAQAGSSLYAKLRRPAEEPIFIQLGERGASAQIRAWLRALK